MDNISITVAPALTTAIEDCAANFDADEGVHFANGILTITADMLEEFVSVVTDYAHEFDGEEGLDDDQENAALLALIDELTPRC